MAYFQTKVASNKVTGLCDARFLKCIYLIVTADIHIYSKCGVFFSFFFHFPFKTELDYHLSYSYQPTQITKLYKAYEPGSSE